MSSVSLQNSLEHYDIDTDRSIHVSNSHQLGVFQHTVTDTTLHESFCDDSGIQTLRAAIVRSLLNLLSDPKDVTLLDTNTLSTGLVITCIFPDIFTFVVDSKQSLSCR